MSKKKEKDKTDNQEKPKVVNKPRWWIETIVDTIVHWFSIFFLASVISSCMTQSDKEKQSRDYDDPLEQVLRNPGLLNNAEANKNLFNQFIDSGSFNVNNEKSGIWIEYKIEYTFSAVPVTVISASGDTTLVERTEIAKYVGEYENGERVGKWTRHELMNSEKPFRWHVKK